jgi:hypothetical protein
MPIDRAALATGVIRLSSGISFLVDPVRANRLWGDPEESAPTRPTCSAGSVSTTR